MNVMGIDPGQSGGVAIIDDEDRPIVYALQMDREEFTAQKIRDMIRDNRVTKVYLEKVHSMPAQGVVSSFKFGLNYGFLRGVVASLKIPIVDVTPQKWMKALSCLTKGDKNVTKNKAQEMFRNIKVTHKIADAMLIAKYGKTEEGIR
jgi:crossover junction endodeoxyribonuclease RuvC